MAIPQIITVAALGWIGFQLLGKKTKKKGRTTSSSAVVDDPPSLDCGLYAWRPTEVDAVLVAAIEGGGA